MVDTASIVRAFDPRESKLNLLLIAVPMTVYFNYFAHDANISFITSMIAIMPLAFLMGKATEEIALRTSESVGGLLNATFGNAAEMIIALFAILAAYNAGVGTETAENMIHIVQASLIGSILGNLLLVMGLSFVWGGASSL
jgi:Ca2+:H+ antiporter